MKLMLALILSSLAALSAKKLRQNTNWSDEASEEVPVAYRLEGGFDFKGKLKSYFTINVALHNPDTNRVCSPVSALLPLGKLVLGSERGQSRDQLLDAIGASKRHVKSTFRNLLNQLQYLPGVILSVASRLYVSKRVNLQNKFLTQTQSVFKSSCEKIDFGNPSKAASKINDWVRDQTKGMISKFIQPSFINRDDSLLIVNAVHFLGMWKVPFTKVEVGNFNSPRGTRKIPMMSRTGFYKYGRSSSLGAELIEIPYDGDSASFIIVLPEKSNGLPLLLRELKVAPGLLNQALESMGSSNVKVTIPKFKIESELDMAQFYKSIGLTEMFGRKSGLTRITEDETVYISKAIQKCIIEVSEKGTEGAAATGVEATPLASPGHFKADRPFLFFVKINREQLFSGIFTSAN